MNDSSSPPSTGALRARFRREGIGAERLGDDPVHAFRRWHADWAATAPLDPALMMLATVDADGLPSIRAMDLVSTDHGFVFVTHGTSPKARDLARRPHAALCFSWPEIGRQVRVSGPVERLPDVQAARAFQQLPHSIRLVAHATEQSNLVPSRATLEQALQQTRSSIGSDSATIPTGWVGYRLLPLRVEFWQQRPDDLQDRILFLRDATDAEWHATRLSP